MGLLLWKGQPGAVPWPGVELAAGGAPGGLRWADLTAPTEPGCRRALAGTRVLEGPFLDTVYFTYSSFLCYIYLVF